MGFFEFPNTRTYDSDLGWLIKHFQLVESQVDVLESWRAIHKIEYDDLKNKVDGLINNLIDVIVPWDSSIAYRVFSIVEYQGTNYIAVQDVPVGAMITNTEYWQPANTVTEQINAISVIVSSIQDKVFWYTPEDFGAYGDGVHDDTEAFQTMFDNVPSHSQIVLDRPLYYIAGTVTCTTPHLIITGGFGRGEFKPEVFTDTEDDTHKTFVFQTSGISIHNCVFRTNSAHGDMLTFDADTAELGGNIDGFLSNCVILRSNHGIITKGRNLRVFDCLLSSMNDAITFLQTTQDVDNRGFEIVNNRVHVVTRFIVNAINNARTMHNIKISNNFLDSCNTLFQGMAGGVVIDGNYMDTVGKNAAGNFIYFQADTSGIPNVVNGNTFRGHGTYTGNGIYIPVGVTVDVLNNDISNVNGSGISVLGDGNIIGNILRNCSNNVSGAYPIVIGADGTGFVVNNILRDCTKAITKNPSSAATVENNYQ